jgi:hypothetical protein
MASAPTGYARRPYAVDTSALRPSHSLRRTGVSSPIAPQRHFPGRAKKQWRCHAFFFYTGTGSEGGQYGAVLSAVEGAGEAGRSREG